LHTHEAYVNGISTSLPPDVQEAIVHSIPGLENALLMRYGYAIEYDYVEPHEILPTLETKKVSGLYLAGQITVLPVMKKPPDRASWLVSTPFLSLNNSDPLILNRSEAYLGVLIDDLVTRGYQRALPHVHLQGGIPSLA